MERRKLNARSQSKKRPKASRVRLIELPELFVPDNRRVRCQEFTFEAFVFTLARLLVDRPVDAAGQAHSVIAVIYAENVFALCLTAFVTKSEAFGTVLFHKLCQAVFDVIKIIFNIRFARLRVEEMNFAVTIFGNKDVKLYAEARSSSILRKSVGF